MLKDVAGKILNLGPTAEIEDLDSLIVTNETSKGAEIIN